MKFKSKSRELCHLRAEAARLRAEVEHQEEALRLRNADVHNARNETAYWKNRHAEAVAERDRARSALNEALLMIPHGAGDEARIRQLYRVL